MRKYLYLTIVCGILLIPQSSDCQTTKILASSNRSFCGFNISKGFYSTQKTREYITKESQPGDESGLADVVSEIMRKLRVDVRIKVYIARDEGNCFATIVKGGTRVIIADQLFLNTVNKEATTRWAAISIIAHEVGHHIAGFGDSGDPLESELAADYWSGYILQNLGSSQTAAIKCIMRYGSDEDSNSHPNKYSRARMITKGWEDGVQGAFDPARCAGCN